MKIKALQTGLAALILPAMVQTASAEQEGRFYINPAVGYQTFDDDRNLDEAFTAIIGGEYVLTPKFGAEVTYMMSSPDIDDGNDDVDLDQYRLGALYYLPESGQWKPFLGAGLTHAEFDFDSSEHEETQLHLGGGARYSFSKDWSGRLEARAINSLDEEDWDALVSIGISYAFGGQEPKKAVYQEPAPVVVAAPVEKDSDGDGVMDSKDQCPTTPKGVQVDSKGCALDSDGDGVADYKDKCPGTPRGVAVSQNGCPLDSDGDGVLDYQDKCPNSPQGAKVDASGCELVVMKTESINLAVNFANNSDVVPQSSYREIQRVADFMNRYPKTTVVIEGHTDDRGNADYNKRLSQRRADSVMQVLTSEFGVDASRAKAVGYGEEQPVADNNTAEGRQKNRRVIANIEHQVKQ